MPQQTSHDPRDRLVREKYFSLRPQPLEQWIWKQSLPPSAERVFWLHWQEGMRNRNWCSEIPLKQVAVQCALDISSVTRAYQALGKLGLIRRQDPGRDPARPFEQAVAITEVRVPRELLQALNRHPNRHGLEAAARAASSPLVVEAAPAAASTQSATSPESNDAGRRSRDPFEGLSGRERMRALGALLARLSARERRQYDEALRTHQAHLSFDADCQLSAEERGRVLQFLQVVAPLPPAAATAAANAPRPPIPGPRKLSVFELARLRRDLHQLVGIERSATLLREVVWSVEEGALRRFTTLHAVRIALKKIREGAWSRPNRMPPNWSRELAAPALLRGGALAETCRGA